MELANLLTLFFNLGLILFLILFFISFSSFLFFFSSAYSTLKTVHKSFKSSWFKSSTLISIVTSSSSFSFASSNKSSSLLLLKATLLLGSINLSFFCSFNSSFNTLNFKILSLKLSIKSDLFLASGLLSSISIILFSLSGFNSFIIFAIKFILSSFRLLSLISSLNKSLQNVSINKLNSSSFNSVFFSALII